VCRRNAFASPSGIALPRLTNARACSNSPFGTEAAFVFRTVLSEVVRPADRVFPAISGAGFAAASELAAIAARARAKKDGMLGTKLAAKVSNKILCWRMDSTGRRMNR
jgi:hypothetical protein